MMLMRLFKLFIFITMLTATGCSVIEKNLYFKPSDNNASWIVKRNKEYRTYYGKDTHYYYSCESSSSVRISFQNAYKSVLLGPPVLSILPIPFWKNHTFQISVSIKTSNNTDIVSLSRHLHFYFNDSLNTSVPFDVVLDNAQKEWNRDFNKSICDTLSKTSKFLWILLRFNINPNSVRNITMNFDDEFNKQLNSNYKPLSVLRKNRLHYCAFFFPAS